MGDVIGPVILGIIISILGISNMKGNISSLHWYHRQRVSPDDVMPFGKRVGLGTLIIGIAIIVFGLFSLITYLTEIEVYTIIGAALLIPAVLFFTCPLMPRTVTPLISARHNSAMKRRFHILFFI